MDEHLVRKGERREKATGGGKKRSKGEGGNGERGKREREGRRGERGRGRGGGGLSTLPETLLYIVSVICSQWSRRGSVCSHRLGICTTCLQHVDVVCI